MEYFAFFLFLYCFSFAGIYYYCNEGKNTEINEPEEKIYGNFY